jgi:hypothetical protein
VLILSFFVYVTFKVPDKVLQSINNQGLGYSDNTDSLINWGHYEKKLARMGGAFFLMIVH